MARKLSATHLARLAAACQAKAAPKNKSPGGAGARISKTRLKKRSAAATPLPSPSPLRPKKKTSLAAKTKKSAPVATPVKKRSCQARKRSPTPPLTPCCGEPGAARKEPCLGCVRAALAHGRTKGECLDWLGARAGVRCFGCASGHKCEKLSALVMPLAKHLWQLLRDGAGKAEL
ncbi:hypothetical protein EJ02DRAFT_428704 [Clathrospora elynae]|uniref:Uncharacterized protein n=1 Tax=Clathrospora elynae TaxID=706981 RepID=A0A6A5S6B0_9PLEO|nr:hypothetical protein EJ02DRAFT_428704 [Clathrospora elynae]